MRFSFLTVIVALTSIMSVSACAKVGKTCKRDSDCCDDWAFCVLQVSRTSLLSPDDSPFGLGFYLGMQGRLPIRKRVKLHVASHCSLLVEKWIEAIL
ncbi:hypothetical protein BD769DRAFT_797311 [Suillus cothurnatus]|nr:hypothetical protein BD769DRAFT_797311 [Suillus cothurnatus]